MERYLPKQESQFQHLVMVDLVTYQQQNHSKSVLLFPPLSSRLRFLIHRTVEDIPDLTTFSVGEGSFRRVVVCPCELRVEPDEGGYSESCDCCCEEPFSRKKTSNSIKPKCPASSQNRGPKRPDQPLFIPRAARKRLSQQNSQGSTTENDMQSCSSNSVSAPSDSCPCTETTQYTKLLCSSAQESNSQVVESKTCLQEKPLKLHENEAHVCNLTQSFTEMNLEDDESADLAFGSESVETQDTSTEMEDVIKQIEAHLKDPQAVSIKLVQNDYCLFEKVSLNSDDFRHVIEIYNFPFIFTTEDLLEAFAKYSDGGIKINWVDNTHALGVFSSEAAALHALTIYHPLIKTRKLSDGSTKAKAKAMRQAEFIQPVKERPRTDCVVAKRMVTRALGIQGRGGVQRY
ncbi:R3H and coiled-coil domain-containing protein 1 [Nothobranchius furzeri]|uniref:R3H domain and coiled-coil containing 1 n=1 Tax=Nothobranchius furzeri TaxID=105023 RepID=A0A1A7ZA32_NOTFU|nr:R3H and coiled-coil domain-containing protein 1 [Nothobranchius furzeri]KAF7208322.1 R3H domain and coiled-coil containing 1 [Nothobranchius furzeri]